MLISFILFILRLLHKTRLICVAKKVNHIIPHHIFPHFLQFSDPESIFSYSLQLSIILSFPWACFMNLPLLQGLKLFLRAQSTIFLASSFFIFFSPSLQSECSSACASDKAIRTLPESSVASLTSSSLLFSPWVLLHESCPTYACVCKAENTVIPQFSPCFSLHCARHHESYFPRALLSLGWEHAPFYIAVRGGWPADLKVWPRNMKVCSQHPAFIENKRERELGKGNVHILEEIFFSLLLSGRKVNRC